MRFLLDTNVVHHLTLVTRNAPHFQSALKAILNPWT